MTSYKKLNKCLCCNSEKLLIILDLKNQPLANSYHTSNDTLENFPLALNLCVDCYHTQLTVAINPDLMFKNYLYVSGTTQTLKEYFEWLAMYLHTKYGNLKRNKNVLDIACNDGSQLIEFKKLGYSVYGVDPAENLAALSRKNGIDLKVGYWNNSICNDLPKMAIITAQNVFAHTSDPYNFLLSCKKVMDLNSILVIQTSQANMFDNNEFDTIYHEHISFFCINSMNEICKRAGFYIEDVLKPTIHGTSYVFIIRKGKNKNIKNIKLEKIKEAEVRDIVYFDNWSKNAKKVVENLKKCLQDLKKEGYKIVGYGAAAKGNTLLNFGKIDLDYIVDDNNMKHSLLTPGMNIKIQSPEVIAKEEKLVIVPLAWNFFKEIKLRVNNIRKNKNTKFVLYFPTLTIENSSDL